MTIKRDILGTVIEIKLSEQEVLAAHRAYLEQELGKMSAPLPQPTKCEMTQKPQPDCNPKLVVAVAVGQEPEYIQKLWECRAKLEEAPYTSKRCLVLDAYVPYMAAAHKAGLSGNKIAQILGTCPLTVLKRLDSIRRGNTFAA